MAADLNQTKKDTADFEQVVRDGYKKTEVGVIPKDWKIEKIEDLFVFLSTSSCSRSDLNSEGEAYYIHYGDIHTKWNFILDFDKEDIPKIELKKVKTATPLIDGDLIFVDASEDEEGSGKAIEIKNVGERIAVAGLHTIAIRSKTEEIADGFKTYIQEFPSFKQQIRSLITGIKVYAISKTSLATIKIPLPPLPEQRAIADALSDVDGLIAALDKLIAKKKAIKQAAMQQLLTGKVRLPGFQKKAGYKKTEVGVIPEDWEILKLGEIAKIYDGTHQTPNYVEDGIPFYSVENVTSRDFKNTKFISTEEHHLLSHSFRIEKGDILMTRIGSIGECVYIDWDVEASFYVSLALLKIHGAHAPFIAAYSNLQAFKKEIEQHSLPSAIPKKINLGAISNIRIALPYELDEQRAIASVLFDMDAEIQALERRREKVKQIKQGMMQVLLTGKIRLS